MCSLSSMEAIYMVNTLFHINFLIYAVFILINWRKSTVFLLDQQFYKLSNSVKPQCSPKLLHFQFSSVGGISKLSVDNDRTRINEGLPHKCIGYFTIFAFSS